MENALTIDVEDYFMVSAFADRIKFDDWPNFESRVERNTNRILDLLGEFSIKATFFVLGWAAEKCPRVVREIDRQGHEIACHGYRHELVYNIGPEKFRDDVRLAKKLLQDICGKTVSGYRAPSYSIVDRSLWALDILIEEGFTYDSSIFPIRHDIYGMPNAERFPHEITTTAGTIQEFPLTTLSSRVFGREVRLPIAGGGYLRLLPAGFVSRGIRRVNQSEGQPAVVYFHPWELDAEQPRISASWKSRFRHYLNLDKMERKVSYLLKRHRFVPLNKVLQQVFPTSLLSRPRTSPAPVRGTVVATS